MVPRALLDLAAAECVAEVAAGRSFTTALAFLDGGAREVVVTDLDQSVLTAPKPLVAHVDDLHDPRLDLYERAVLLYGVRLPEELQAPALALARRVGATFAFKPLKDEVAYVEGVEWRLLGGGWRLGT